MSPAAAQSPGPAVTVEPLGSDTLIPILASLPGVTIARAQQTLTIGAAEADIAGHLGIPLGAPVAFVRRVFRAPDGTVIDLGEVTYRGDLIELEMDLVP